jgi:hypothetical protein
MKKIVMVLVMILFLSGCSTITAKDATVNFLEEYKNLSDDVIKSLESEVESEDLTEEEQDVYRRVLKRQYQDLEYKIESEKYNGDTAIVKANITVYDLYEAQKDAVNYVTLHQEEFMSSSDTLNQEYVMDYRLNMMLNTTNRVTYTIDFEIEKDEDDIYQVVNVNQEILEKIHGIYDYEND